MEVDSLCNRSYWKHRSTIRFATNAPAIQRQPIGYAKVVDIAGRDNGTIKVTYKYKVGKKAYKSFKLQKPKEINIGDETEIRISESKPKKIFTHNREEDAVFPEVAATFLFFVFVTTLVFG